MHQSFAHFDFWTWAKHDSDILEKILYIILDWLPSYRCCVYLFESNRDSGRLQENYRVGCQTRRAVCNWKTLGSFSCSHRLVSKIKQKNFHYQIFNI